VVSAFKAYYNPSLLRTTEHSQQPTARALVLVIVAHSSRHRASKISLAIVVMQKRLRDNRAAKRCVRPTGIDNMFRNFIIVFLVQFPIEGKFAIRAASCIVGHAERRACLSCRPHRNHSPHMAKGPKLVGFLEIIEHLIFVFLLLLSVLVYAS
jgi:hypothetical protein